MPKTISKDIPLAELTLRKYEKPYKASKRENIRKVCLSVGLLQPGDSRDVIVDVLSVLLDAKGKKHLLASEEIVSLVIKNRKKEKLPLNGIASSNIRRQIKRLKDLHLVENVQNQYRIHEFDNLSVIFEKRIKDFYLNNILERVEEYFKQVK